MAALPTELTEAYNNALQSTLKYDIATRKWRDRSSATEAREVDTKLPPANDFRQGLGFFLQEHPVGNAAQLPSTDRRYFRPEVRSDGTQGESDTT